MSVERVAAVYTCDACFKKEHGWHEPDRWITLHHHRRSENPDGPPQWDVYWCFCSGECAVTWIMQRSEQIRT